MKCLSNMNNFFFFHNVLSAKVLIPGWRAFVSWHTISISFFPSLCPSPNCISHFSFSFRVLQDGALPVLPVMFLLFPFTVCLLKCVVCFLVVFAGFSCLCCMPAYLHRNKQKVSFALKTVGLKMRLSSTEPLCQMEKNRSVGFSYLLNTRRKEWLLFFATVRDLHYYYASYGLCKCQCWGTFHQDYLKFDGLFSACYVVVFLWLLAVFWRK